MRTSFYFNQLLITPAAMFMFFIQKITTACLLLSVYAAASFAQVRTDSSQSVLKTSINWISLKKLEQIRCDSGLTKKVYVFFDTDWCAACRMMERNAFEDPEVINYLNTNFYCVKFNAELLDEVIFDEKKFGKTVHKSWQCNAFAASYLGDYFAFPAHLILERDTRKMTAAAGAKTAYEMMLMLSYFNEYHFLTTDIDTYSSSYEPPSWKGKKGGRAGTNRRRSN